MDTRPSGVGSAAVRSPWYLRVGTLATVPAAYAPSPLVTSHSRASSVSESPLLAGHSRLRTRSATGHPIRTGRGRQLSGLEDHGCMSRDLPIGLSVQSGRAGPAV